MEDIQKIKEEYKKYLANNVLKHLTVKLILAIIILFYFVYSDLGIRHNIQAFYTRILPIILGVFLLIFHLATNKFQYAKIKIYNIFLTSVLLMMLAKCIVHLNETGLASVVSGTILVIFLISLEIKTNLINTIIIYFAPFIIFILLLFFFFDITKEQHITLTNIYPIVILGFAVNRIQNKLSFNVFKSNFLLNSEKEKTKELYEETLSINNELNQKNEEIVAQRDEIETQRNEIEKAHKHVLSSVNYAQRIQNAMLPTNELFKEHFSEYFILYKPRDIVSGDFYWAKKINNTLFFAAADCTGHGVPGAFVSMLGMSLLNEIVGNHEITTAGQILDNLRCAIKTSLKQTNAHIANKDGMDIALCMLNLDTNELQYAGAYNPLFIIRDNELVELKADRQPIAIYLREKEFTNHTFSLQKDDILYLFSDGYIDQFNGVTNEKFNISRFRKLLNNIANKSLTEQKQILEQNLNQWQGNTKQLDDILIIGTKIR